MSTQKWKDENPDKIKESRRRWYLKNTAYAKKKSKERREKMREWLLEKKKTLKCETCGMNHPACLQFHHIDPSKKDMEVTDAVERGFSIEKIEAEIAKCKVLCANCHFIFHWNN